MTKKSKHEKRLLKAAERLEAATKRYMEELVEVDKVMQNLPTKVTRAFMLEDKYFAVVPKIATASVKMELLWSSVKAELYKKEQDSIEEEEELTWEWEKGDHYDY